MKAQLINILAELHGDKLFKYFNKKTYKIYSLFSFV